MGCYVIAVGGTGAKCAEALTHVCAAGLMPDGQNEIHLLFVDPDISNGNLGRARKTLESYREFRRLGLGENQLLKTELTTAPKSLWSPLERIGGRNLDEIFTIDVLRATAGQKPLTQLFDVLYGQRERRTDLGKGFRGHPSIGAAILARTLDLEEGDPWETFRHKIRNDVKNGDEARVLLVGSIFGGTGAAGLPTIARLVRRDLGDTARLRLGTVLALPYFQFNPEGQGKGELRAASEDFLMNTKAALHYYERHCREVQTVYVLGDEFMTSVRFSVGAGTQMNDPHYVELYGALAAVDFFGGRSEGCCLVSRREATELGWDDLPFEGAGGTLREKIGQLARLAFAYLAVYYPMLEDIRTHGRGDRAPWFIDFFKRASVSLGDSATQEGLDRTRSYLEAFLRWLFGIHVSGGDVSVRLINHNAFAGLPENGATEMKFKFDEFGQLVLPKTDRVPHALSNLWEMMCARRRNQDGSSGSPVGRFISALYHECGES